MEWPGYIIVEPYGTVKVLFKDTTLGPKIILRKLGKKGDYFKNVSKHLNNNLRDLKWLMKGKPIFFN